MTTTRSNAAPIQDAAPRTRRWLILAVLCLTLLTVVLDNTVLNVALPSLTTELGASTADVQWMINAYSIAMAGMLMAAGSAADRYGRKRALLAGLLLFGAGSAAATFADVPGQVVAARAVMGVGAALLTPCTLAVLVQTFTDTDERRKAIGIWAAVSSAGIACGPVIGGLLLAHFWWGSIFLLNVPVAAIAMIAVAILVPESKNPARERPDVPGGVLSAVIMVALVMSVITAGERGWGAAEVWIGLAVCVAALTGFVIRQRRAAVPMLDLAMFAERRFTGAVAGGLLGAFGMASALFLITQHLQFVLGFSPLTAGFAIAPLAISTMISSSLLSARAGRRLGDGRTMALGMIAAAGGLTAIAVTGRDGYPATAVGLVVVGLGVGLAMPVAAHALLGAMPPERAGTGSGLMQSLQEVGASLGVAVLGAVLTARFAAGLPAVLGGDAARSLPTALAGTGGDPGLRDRVTSAFADSMTVSQLVAAAAVCCGGLVAGYLLSVAQRPAPVVPPRS